MESEDQRARVREWLRKAPFDDPGATPPPDFSYEGWFEEGRQLPRSVEILVEFLEEEDLERPSGEGMRAAYALGWIGDDRKPAIDALLRALDSRDVVLRAEAAAALGRLGDPSVLPALKKLLRDKAEDINVRANACVSIGRLGDASSEGVLRETLNDDNPFLVRCAERALRLLGTVK